MRTLALALLGCCLAQSPLVAEQDSTPSPTVTSYDCPKYPSKAESMRLQGRVVLQVTTDGNQVVDVKLTSGHPWLAPDAIKNVRTWKFADHTPTTFSVKYYYINDGHYERDKVTKCSAKMELPRKVTVSTSFSF
jgi:outer membrane biosynthesis protein TonB